MSKPNKAGSILLIVTQGSSRRIPKIFSWLDVECRRLKSLLLILHSLSKRLTWEWR